MVRTAPKGEQSVQEGALVDHFKEEKSELVLCREHARTHNTWG